MSMLQKAMQESYKLVQNQQFLIEVPIPGLRSFTVKHSAGPQLDAQTFGKILSPSEPLFFASVEKLRRRDTECLWWEVMVKKNVFSKAVVRNWVRKRIQNACIEALRARGFDKAGRPLFGGRDCTRRPTEAPSKLLGTLRFLATEEALTTKNVDLRQEMDIAMDTMVPVCSKPRNKQRDALRLLRPAKNVKKNSRASKTP